MRDAFTIIKHPLSTEKSIRLMESENKMIFVVDKKATKTEIKKAIEKMLGAKVRSVNTLVSPRGEKRAYIQFTPEVMAMDVASNLGLM